MAPSPRFRSGRPARLEDRAYRLFKANDVLGRQLGREVGITVDDRPQQRNVFGDVLAYIRQPVEEQTPDAGRVGVLAHQHVLQIGVAGCLVDRSVHPHVEPQEGTRVVVWVELGDLIGEFRQLFPGFQRGEAPIVWTDDGKALYVTRPGERPAKITRLDVATVQRTPWKELMSTVVAKVPRRGYAMTSRSRSSRLSASRTGVRPNPS